MEWRSASTDTVGERARSMLLGSGLPVRFWEHAVRYASWLMNRLPTAGIPNYGIPYTRLYGEPPNLAMAKVFGCLAHVWVDPGVLPKKLKFGPRSRWGVFIGVSEVSKGWEFFVPSSGEVGFLSRNAFFHEDSFLHDLKGKEGDEPVLNTDGSERPLQADVEHLFASLEDETRQRRVHWPDASSTESAPSGGPFLGSRPWLLTKRRDRGSLQAFSMKGTPRMSQTLTQTPVRVMMMVMVCPCLSLRLSHTLVTLRMVRIKWHRPRAASLRSPHLRFRMRCPRLSPL